MSMTIPVTTASGSYDAVVGAGVLAELGGRMVGVSRARAVLLVHDAGLPAEMVERVRATLECAGLRVERARVLATELGKSLPVAGELLESAAGARLDRRDAIVALGGGVVGDVAGFVASTYRRGIDLIHCPTTLLAMVDASIGGKTAVNLVRSGPAGRMLKNMVGTFHQPRLVLADVEALWTLPARHLRAGLAECVKHALLAGDVDGVGAIGATACGPPWTPDKDLALIERFASSPGDAALAIDLIARHVGIKAAVVALDEREGLALHADSPGRGERDGGGADAFPAREALNLGHTFGHALEALAHLSPDGDAAHAPLHHGEAVGLGLLAATATSEALGLVVGGSAARVRGVLAGIGLPTRVRGLPGDDALIDAMMDDKKVLGGRLRLILPSGELGRVRVCEGPAREAVAAGLDAIRV